MKNPQSREKNKKINQKRRKGNVKYTNLVIVVSEDMPIEDGDRSLSFLQWKVEKAGFQKKLELFAFLALVCGFWEYPERSSLGRKSLIRYSIWATAEGYL